MCSVYISLCNELISRSEEFYNVYMRARECVNLNMCVCLIVCDLENCTMWRPKTDTDCGATKKKKYIYIYIYTAYLWRLN
jgi:hypothetical protein